MSIYRTVAEFGFRRHGTDTYVDVLAQAVPPHIKHVGPTWDFLPPPVDPHGRLFRAVFFVERSEPKGTDHSGQEYPHPLLAFTGQEYHDVRFVDLMMRLADALNARYGAPEWEAEITVEEKRWFVD
jgi:hypothetical protein